jgi:putative membrane protein
MIRPLLAGVACVALLAACNQEQSPEPVDKAQDMAAAPVGQMSAATLGANTVGGYVPNAAEGDMYEIMAADIALERSQNAQVKELAQMIKTDHTAASNAMKALLPQAAPDVQMPTELDERRQGMLDNLRSASAETFDQVYLDQQIAAHNEAVTLHRGFSDNADAPRLAEHARTVLPKIEMHLRRAEELREAM